MPKSALEKQIEKATRQAKQQAEKRLREEKRQADKNARMEREKMRQEKAASIVAMQPFVEGVRILDHSSEELLKVILNQEIADDSSLVKMDDSSLPVHLQGQSDLEFEKLVQYGMISGLSLSICGTSFTVLPAAFTYFSDKEIAMRKQDERQQQYQIGSIVNSGNLVLGNVADSTISIDNSFSLIEKKIDEEAGEDAADLKELLEEIKELIENIESSRTIPKQKKLFERITEHAAKHGWFYGAVLQLLGTAAMNLLGK